MHGFDILLGQFVFCMPFYSCAHLASSRRFVGQPDLTNLTKSLSGVLYSRRSEDCGATSCFHYRTARIPEYQGHHQSTTSSMLKKLFLILAQVSSTETGVIFGSILWEGTGMAEACVILNDIHIDIMDYIKPAFCSENQVRQPSENAMIYCLRSTRVSSAVCGLNLSGKTGST